MFSIKIARALKKAATVVTGRQMKMTKKPGEKAEKGKLLEDTYEAQMLEESVQTALPDQEILSSLSSDIIPVINRLSGTPLVTRPTPIPLEVDEEELSKGSLPEELGLPESKDALLPDLNPEPNVKMIMDLSEIRAAKKRSDIKTPETKPILGLSTKKTETIDQKPVFPEIKPVIQAEKLDLQSKPLEVKSETKEGQGKKADSKNALAIIPKESENKENKSLFDNLFNKKEEKEETSLDRLIKTLPEITIEDILIQSEEVNSLINNWN